jgi:N-succinyldiaminopimelate aminotransferase
MNPDLDLLQPYPFEKLRALFAEAQAVTRLPPINLSIGEPKHPTPPFIKETLARSLDGLASYPPTAGSPALREAIAQWIARRYAPARPDPATEVLPVNGSREALFAFAQAVIDRRGDAHVLCPNPFYQIYEGAALLAGARPYFVNSQAADGFRLDYAGVPQAVLRSTQLAYVCSPGNPTGRVLDLEEWRALFELSDRFGFVIAADECYSEIHFDEAHPPLGALAAACLLGRPAYERLVVFSSLSKRSNVPGMRSGFVAGDAGIIKRFLLYRTYHGGAMSPAVQAASIAAWGDEEHVVQNRRLYAAKFASTLPLVEATLGGYLPQGGFYLWLRTPLADVEFARGLHAECAVDVLPGSFLARSSGGVNPGEGRIRLALVAGHDECLEGVRRTADFAARFQR